MNLMVKETGSWLVIPESESSSSRFLEDLSSYVKIIDFAFKHPGSFSYQVGKKLSLDCANLTLTTFKPVVKEALTGSAETFLFSTKEFIFQAAYSSIPMLLQTLELSKSAIQIMFSDLFEAFVAPLSEQGTQPLFSEGSLTLGMIGISLLIHKLASKYLKQDPEVGKSITYGAITGAILSFIMDYDPGIGTLSGAITGLMTDAALSCITYNSLTLFLKKERQKLEQTAKNTYKVACNVFPYLFFTFGTALVYSQLKPLASKWVEGMEIPSQKIYTLKLVALSGFLFGIGKSYLIPAVQIAWNHIKIGLNSARDVSSTFSWGPRILMILCITSTISKKINYKTKN